MEFKVKSSELVSMLKIVIKGFDSRDDASFIYFKVNDNKLFVTSNSATAYFQGNVNVTGYSENEDDSDVFYVDGEVLRRLSDIFPDAPVMLSFSINQNSRVFVVKYTGHSFRLPIVSDTHEMEKPDTVKLGMIQAPDFFDVLNSLNKIVDKDSSVQEFPSSCLHLGFTGNEMTAMGTDRFTIAEVKKEYTPDEENQDYHILIRQPQAALLSKPINPAEALTIVYTSKMFGYIDGEGILSLVGRTDMTPLNYLPLKKQAIDMAKDAHSVTVDFSDFKNTLDTMGKLAFVNSTLILKFDSDGKAKIMSTSGDIMDLATISADGFTGENEETYNFNLNVLGRALIPVDTETLRLQWGNPDSEQSGSLFQLIPVDNDGNDEKNIFIGVMPENA